MLVLCLISDLRHSHYDTVATLFQQSIPTPSFAVARSRLLLEETLRATENNSSPSALVLPPTAPSSTTTPPSPSPSTYGPVNGRDTASRGRGRGRGRNNQGRGRGRTNSQHNNRTGHYSNPIPSSYNAPAQLQHLLTQLLSQVGLNQSPIPPFPYPQHQPSHLPQSTTRGLLGPRPTAPAHSYLSSTPGPLHTPTELTHALSTLQLHPPDDNWYMDSGASSHDQ